MVYTFNGYVRTARFNCYNRDLNAETIRVDFHDGKTTTITINSTLDPNDTEFQLYDCYEYEMIVS